MPDKVRITATFEYTLPEEEERLRSYGTTDPKECMEIDRANLYNDGEPYISSFSARYNTLKMELIDESEREENDIFQSSNS